MTADLYQQWLKAQKTAKIAAEAHGWDSEEAAAARKAEDDLFRKTLLPARRRSEGGGLDARAR